MGNEGDPARGRVVVFSPRFDQQAFAIKFLEFVSASKSLTTTDLVSALKNEAMARKKGTCELAWEIRRRFPNQEVISDNLGDWRLKLSKKKRKILDALMAEALFDKLEIPEEKRKKLRSFNIGKLIEGMEKNEK